MLTTLTTDQTAQRGIELLNELLASKSAVDGVPRSPRRNRSEGRL